MIKFSLNFFVLSLLLLFAYTADGQEYVYVSSDSTVQMEVKRENKAIIVSLIFKRDSQLERLVIERSVQPTTGFTQCRYLKTNNSAGEVITLSFRDNFASYIQEYYYRLKTISLDGIERSYPPLHLFSLLDSKFQ